MLKGKSFVKSERTKTRTPAALFLFLHTGYGNALNVAYKSAFTSQQLLDAVLASGTQVKTGAQANSVDITQNKISFEDGTIVEADLKVAADGVHVGLLFNAKLTFAVLYPTIHCQQEEVFSCCVNRTWMLAIHNAQKDCS